MVDSVCIRVLENVRVVSIYMSSQNLRESMLKSCAELLIAKPTYGERSSLVCRSPHDESYTEHARAHR